MKPLSSIATCMLGSALLALTPAQAQEKAGVVVAGAVETVVTVVDVDREARVVTVRGPKGGLTPINVPPEAQNLDQVQPGARFKVEYVRSVALALKKGTGTGSATSSQGKSVRLAPKGGTPGGSIVHTFEVNAVVEKMNREDRTMTVRASEGGPIELEVDEAVKSFDQVEIGDIVTVQYTEGLAMHMIHE